MNLIASLGQGAPAPREPKTVIEPPAEERKAANRKGRKPGTRIPPSKGGATAAIIEVLASADGPLLMYEIVEATGKGSNAVSIALLYGTRNGDFVREGRPHHYRYSLRRFE